MTRLVLFALLGFAGIAHAAGARAIFNVRDHGATGDGSTLETAAINRAVEACAGAGGGIVHVPPGRYLTGTVRLLSHVTLELEGGAVLLGSENPGDYPEIPDPWSPHGTGNPTTAPLIYAENAKNITIANCIVHHAHGGVTIGSEMSGGVRNVTVSNCVFQSTDNGIRLKTERGRGGVVEGLVVSNIVMQDVPTPFQMTMFYSKSADRFGTEPVDETTPVFRDMLFSNITARGAKAAGHIFGLAESPVEDITFSNVHIDAAKGLDITHARGITFLDSVIAVESGPALVLKNTQNVNQKRLTAREAAP